MSTTNYKAYCSNFRKYTCLESFKDSLNLFFFFLVSKHLNAIVINQDIK